MSRWIYEIENELETFEVRPKVANNTIKWEREDDRLFDFTKTIGELIFSGEDYRRFLSYEEDNHCMEQIIRVYQVCGQTRRQRFESEFSMSSGRWDLDKCTVQFKLEETDKYLCVKRKKEHDIFTLIKPNQEVDWGIEITVDVAFCGFEETPDCDDQIWDVGHWGIRPGVNVMGNIIANYLRFRLISPYYISQEFDGWVYYEMDGSNYVYVRKFEYDNQDDVDLLNEITYVENENGFIIDVGSINRNIKNGFNLLDVLTLLLKKTCPDLKIVSDFFQWNPENPSLINYVTGEASFVNNLKLYQKSDIKRPNATNPATKAETNFMKLFSDVLRIFNCGYFMEGNTLRVEHISWFEKNQNLNLVDIAIDTKQTSLRGTRKYSYDKTKLPKFEYFEWMDEVSKEFEGTPIWYDNGCVEDDDDLADSLTNRVENTTTDMLYCFTNSGSGSGVSDSGFVIVATDSQNRAIWATNSVDIGGALPNGVLSWPFLHKAFWMHGRVQMSGYMNVPTDEDEWDATPVLTQFKSSVPVKDQVPFSIRLCCDQISEFNPLDLQRSTLGWGEVKSAELSMGTDMMQFELMFKQD